MNGLRKHPSWEVQQLVLFSNLKKIWVDWVAAEIMVGTSLELCIFFIKYNVYFNPGIIPIRISISRINLLCVCCPVNIEVIYYISSWLWWNRGTKLWCIWSGIGLVQMLELLAWANAAMDEFRFSWPLVLSYHLNFHLNLWNNLTRCKRQVRF